MNKTVCTNRIRRLPTIAIAVAASFAVFAVLVGDVEERYIYTFAGNGEGGTGGDGGPATEAQLSDPQRLAVDGSGNLYVSDTVNHLIRRIDPEGVITTIAGTGEGGYGGDGGPATEARLFRPGGLAVDGSGNLHVADISNYRIRKIDPEGVITTIAGTGEPGYGGDGDGGPATEARLFRPGGLAVDGSGNLYVADTLSNRIRKIDSEGVITTIAGTGERGYGGDGGPAAEAQLNSPDGLVLDGSGNLYVADASNHRIRKIDSEGMITTIAGTGESGYGGDGGPAAEAQLRFPYGLALDGSGNLYVADASNHRIRKIDSEGMITTIAGTGESGYGGDGGPAAEAQLGFPYGLALDGSGNLYVPDSTNNRVRVIRPPGERNPVTQEFPHFANGDATLSDLVLVNVDTKTITPVVRFYGSTGDPISADSVVDLTDDLEFAADGALTVKAGIKPLGERTISTHGRGALSSGSVRVVSDGYVGGFLRFDSMAVGVAGVGAADPLNDALFPARRKEGGINTGAAVRNLASEAVTLTCHLMQSGNVLETAMVELAADGQQARFINELFPDADTSAFEGSVRCTAPEGKKFTGVALEMDIRNRIFTTLPIVTVDAGLRGDVDEPYIFTFAGTGESGYGGDGGPATEAQLSSPLGLVLDGTGNLYVTESVKGLIRRIDPEGVITTIAGTGERGYGGDDGPAAEAQLGSAVGLALDGSGNLYVADGSNHRIRKIDSQGVITTIAGTGERGYGGDDGPAAEAQLDLPTGLALDGSGNLYVADGRNHRIRKIDSQGVITTIAGTGERGYGGDDGPAAEAQLYFPYGLALDGSGNLYVADSRNHRIRKIDSEGVITTIAGTGEWGYGGDDGPAAEAQLYSPYGLALDGSGNLFVTDAANHRIRKIDSEGMITTIAGTGESGYGGDGGPAAKAQFRFPYGLAVDGSGNLFVADYAHRRVRIIRPPGERNPVTQEFPHFANGDSTLSDLVLVNVDTKTITPAVRFYGSTGDPISADSVVDLTDDMELAADGALTVKAGIKPLGERTISTHGRGALTSGSVRVVSDGYVGGFLRFDSMAVGVAGVGAADPLNDALFPARRKEGGINTGAAVRNLASEAVTLTCHLMQSGNVLETAMVELAADGQQARFINELFPDADTSAFEGSVRCTAPEGKKFTGVALEMDSGNRIFTTLPLVPVRR